MEFTVEMSNYVSQLRELVNSAQNQLSLAETAHNDANDRDLASAHRALGGTLRSMQRVFKSMSDAGAKADSDKNKKVGTSTGITQGVSSPPSPPRAGSADGRATAPQRATPLMQGDIKGFLDRARIGGRR
jgi:hypothetical protein